MVALLVALVILYKGNHYGTTRRSLINVAFATTSDDDAFETTSDDDLALVWMDTAHRTELVHVRSSRLVAPQSAQLR
ncbi:unnamed protein product [Angiostrongylus costaricensis]|uniref:Secreted protein n=1 Tax=Angiostrongylus costaricensis TaxID=334426 RepID=A0A0R3PQH4_ANGCS|nr:unnamed protein product [Angiostrongylus costaricensis]